MKGFDTKGIGACFNESKAIDVYAREKVKYVCRGGLFGGHKDFIAQANSTYYSLLQDKIDIGESLENALKVTKNNLSRDINRDKKTQILNIFLS